MNETSDEALQKAINKSWIHQCAPELRRVSRVSHGMKVPRLWSILRLLAPGGRAARVPQSTCSAHHALSCQPSYLSCTPRWLVSRPVHLDGGGTRLGSSDFMKCRRFVNDSEIFLPEIPGISEKLLKVR